MTEGTTSEYQRSRRTRRPSVRVVVAIMAALLVVAVVVYLANNPADDFFVDGKAKLPLVDSAAGSIGGGRSRLLPDTEEKAASGAEGAPVVNSTAGFLVSPVPALESTTRVRIVDFNRHDLDGDGSYSALEFGKALYLLATTNPTPGSPKLSTWARYRGADQAQAMARLDAIVLLNTTSDEFLSVDRNNDWRITRNELRAVSLM